MYPTKHIIHQQLISKILLTKNVQHVKEFYKHLHECLENELILTTTEWPNW